MLALRCASRLPSGCTTHAPLSRRASRRRIGDGLPKSVTAPATATGEGKQGGTTCVEKAGGGRDDRAAWAIFNRQGQRKYLTSTEVDSFVRSARKRAMDVRMFCWMLAFTGCRISEALSLTRDSIDFEAKHVIIRCLKKRGRQVFRAIPLPPDFLIALRRWRQERVSSADI